MFEFARQVYDEFRYTLLELFLDPDIGSTYLSRLLALIVGAHMLGESARYFVINPLVGLVGVPPFGVGTGALLLIGCSVASGLLWYLGRAGWLYCFGFSLGPGGLRGRASFDRMFRPDRLSLWLLGRVPAGLSVPWLAAGVVWVLILVLRLLSG